MCSDSEGWFSTDIAPDLVCTWSVQIASETSINKIIPEFRTTMLKYYCVWWWVDMSSTFAPAVIFIIVQYSILGIITVTIRLVSKDATYTCIANITYVYEENWFKINECAHFEARSDQPGFFVFHLWNKFNWNCGRQKKRRSPIKVWSGSWIELTTRANVFRHTNLFRMTWMCNRRTTLTGLNIYISSIERNTIKVKKNILRITAEKSPGPSAPRLYFLEHTCTRTRMHAYISPAE